MSLPPWTRSSTEPTSDELARFHSDLDPAVLGVVRTRTEPTLGEVARIRPRLARRSVPVGWIAAVAVAALLGLAVGRGVVTDSPSRTALRELDAGLYVVRPGEIMTSIAGVRASGNGVLRQVPGAVRADGVLHLDITGPLALETALARFTTDGARVDLDDTAALWVAAGAVRAPDGRTLRAGDRWPPAPAAAVVEVVPVVAGESAPSGPSPAVLPAAAPREPIVAPPPVVESPAAVAPVAPRAPSGPLPEIAAWREVLTAIERDVPAPERARLCSEYANAWPESPLALEALALALLARAEFDTSAAVLADIETSLEVAPRGPRALELRARAAWLARERLRDCTRAEPHDRVLAEIGGATGQRARALLGLCAATSGRLPEARAILAEVAPDTLEPALAAAVRQLLETP